MSFCSETPYPHETPALRVEGCAEQSAAANAAAFVHMAELTMLECLEVSGWQDPGASADWARLRQLTALTSLTLTTCQYPRYVAFTGSSHASARRASQLISVTWNGVAIPLYRMPPVLPGTACTAHTCKAGSRRQTMMSAELC